MPEPSIALLTLSTSRSAGGLFSAMTSLARELDGRGRSVAVYACADPETRRDAPAWGPVRTVACDAAGPNAFRVSFDLARALETGNPDLVHLHGLWTFPSVIAYRWGRRTGRPVLVSPHGMLDPGALAISGWKKRIARLAFENRNLRNAACLHALNDAEHRAIRALGFRNPVAVIANGVALPVLRARPAPAGPFRTLLFLGRIHPKKGLSELLRAWALLEARGGAAKAWRLVVAGWDDGGHLPALKELAADLGLGDRVAFVGPVFGREKDETLAAADAFVLPSRSEGLPMAVLEAWAWSLPVFMTAECNLPEGFAVGAARQIATRADAMADGLEQGLADPCLAAMGAAGRRLVEERYTLGEVAARFMAVHDWLVNDAPPPSCIRFD